MVALVGAAGPATEVKSFEISGPPGDDP
jgi:hypothetical protein